MMTATETRTYRLGEFHRFEGGEQAVPLSGSGGRDLRAGRCGIRSDRRAFRRGSHARGVGGKALATRASHSTKRPSLSRKCFRRAPSWLRSTRRRAVANPPAGFPAAKPGDESDEPVQPIVHVLLRIRRGQSRHARRQAEVHGLRDGQGFGGFPAGAVRGPQVGSHHLLRRRNADEFPAAEASGGLRERARRGTGASRRFQPHHQRHAADPGHHRVSLREQHRRHRQHGWPAGFARQAARLRERARQLRHHRAARSRR